MTLVELRGKGLRVRHVEKLNTGINSLVYKLKDKSGTYYILKIYPYHCVKDRRDRQNTEKLFLDHLNIIDVNNVARIVEYNKELNWTLFECIDGIQPNHLGEGLAKAAVEFLSMINKLSVDKTVFANKAASEAGKSINYLSENLKFRLDSLLIVEHNSSLEEKAIGWLRKTIEPRIKNTIEIAKSKMSETQWRESTVFSTLSPSDVGIHNSIQNSGGYFFVDFEYAGRDDLAKFIGDWLHHPDHRMTNSFQKTFLESIDNNRNLPSSGLSRYEDIKDIIVLKWCLIMLNPLLSNNLTKSRLDKTIGYYEAQNYNNKF